MQPRCPRQRVAHEGVDLRERFLRIQFVDLDHDLIMDVHDDAIARIREARDRRSEAVACDCLCDILREFAAIGAVRPPVRAKLRAVMQGLSVEGIDRKVRAWIKKLSSRRQRDREKVAAIGGIALPLETDTVVESNGTRRVHHIERGVLDLLPEVHNTRVRLAPATDDVG